MGRGAVEMSDSECLRSLSIGVMTVSVGRLVCGRVYEYVCFPKERKGKKRRRKKTESQSQRREGRKRAADVVC